MQRILIFFFLWISHAQAGEIWNWNAGVQSILTQYSGSQIRDGVNELGVLFSGDYLEQGGLTLGLSKTVISFKQSQPQIDQDALFLSGRAHFYPDGTQGKVTLRVDGHLLKNNDLTGDTNEVQALAVQTSYLPNDRQYYFDLGVADSQYRNNLSVVQFTPTVGIACGFDWLQLRGYFIQPSDPARAQGLNSTSALEVKYTHWLEAEGTFAPNNLQFGALLGKRIYAVDMDAGGISNLADVQNGGLTLGAEWKLAENTKLLLLGGQNRYDELKAVNSYQANFLYLNLNSSW
jgi:hypothetical protein